MQNYILYLAFGQDYINECIYSILRMLELYNLRPPKFSIVVFTDEPQKFENLIPYFHQFSIKTISANDLKKWRGQPPNNYRVKALVIKEFLSSIQGNLVFCDTDTILLKPIEPLFRDIENDCAFMHTYEGEIIENSCFKKLHRKLTNPKVSSIQFSDFNTKSKWEMWNSGIVALNTNKDLFKDLVSLTDYIFSKVKNHTSEQLAISYLLSKETLLKEAKSYFYHFWDLKEFRKLLLIFFEKNQEESIPNLVKKAHHIDAITIQQQKTSYKRLPLAQRFVRNLSGSAWSIRQYEKKL